MSYSDEDKPSAKVGRVLAFGVALLIASNVGRAIFGGGLSAEQAYEQEVAQSSVLGPLFFVFKDRFPEDHARFKAEVVAKLKAGATNAEIKAFSFNWMRAFMTSHKGDIAKAPDPNLVKFAQAQSRVAQALKVDSTAMCAHFVMSGLAQSDQPNDASARALSDLVTAQLEASAAGLADPHVRDTSTMSKPDAVALVTKMRSMGASESEIAILGSSTGLSAETPEVQCSIGSRMIEAAAALPSEQAARIAAFSVLAS